jgi:hypothetical protein
VDAQGLPEPTPTQQVLLEEVLKLVNRTGQLGTGSWIGKQDYCVPTPTTVDVANGTHEHKELGTRHQLVPFASGRAGKDF